jgi:nanoRNase/pAp phosphatase (c-di-AMP/oligoRNAs hydrolase)
MSLTINFNEILNNKNLVNVIIHNFPDPDAISSALGIMTLIKHLGFKFGDIYYTGEISHPQNRTLVSLLNIQMIDYNENPFTNGSDAILIDTNNVGEESNQAYIKPENVNIIAVIDHHKGKHPKNAKVDYRQTGSCASIVWDYLNQSNFDFNDENAHILATALITGIFTDTNSLMSDNISELDFQAYQDLLKYADNQKLRSIMNYPLPTYLFELRQKAFQEENQMNVESTIVCGIGIIKPAKRDALPIIADELLRMSGITTSIVFAIVDECIDISIRSNDIALDITSFVQDVFGTGGGKQGAGRARIPLGFFSMNESDEHNNNIWELSKKLVFNNIRKNIQGN